MVVQINQNLKDQKHGINNFETYVSIIEDVLRSFALLFGEEIMTKYPLYIDNGYSHAGSLHTIKPIFNKFLHLKTGIADGKDKSEVLFQLTYNLTHYVFYSKFGLERPYLTEYRDYCTGMAIVIVRMDDKDAGSFYEDALKNEIPNGVDIAKRNNYSIFGIAKEILEYELN